MYVSLLAIHSYIGAILLLGETSYIRCRKNNNIVNPSLSIVLVFQKKFQFFFLNQVTALPPCPRQTYSALNLHLRRVLLMGNNNNNESRNRNEEQNQNERAESININVSCNNSPNRRRRDRCESSSSSSSCRRRRRCESSSSSFRCRRRRRRCCCPFFF